jgi:hypothetical protein
MILNITILTTMNIELININILPVEILTQIINETDEHMPITGFVCKYWNNITRGYELAKINFVYVLSRNNINLLQWFCENYLHKYLTKINIEYDDLQYFGYDKMNNFLIKHNKYCHVYYRYPTNILYISSCGQCPNMQYESDRVRRLIKNHKTNEKYINSHNQRDDALANINVKLLIKQCEKESEKILNDLSNRGRCKNS